MPQEMVDSGQLLGMQVGKARPRLFQDLDCFAQVLNTHIGSVACRDTESVVHGLIEGRLRVPPRGDGGALHRAILPGDDSLCVRLHT